MSGTMGGMASEFDDNPLDPEEELDDTDEQLQERLAEAASGIIDLDHTLAIVRWGKGFPADTVVIEVEPADRSFGLGFSEEVEAIVDTVLALVREEVGMNQKVPDPTDRGAAV